MAQAISQDDYLKDTSQFDYARKRATEQSGANLQARKDALARRFAALGNLDSGARIKIEEQAANEEAGNLNNANEGINAQQQAELGRRKEVVQGQQFASGEAEKQRAYGTSERIAGQQFGGEQAAMQRAYGTSEREAGQEYASGQNDIQRKFATGERLSSQDFAALQSQLGRDFTTQEREQLQKYQSGEREAGQAFTSGEAAKQRQAQEEQFTKTYGLSLDQFKAAQDQFAQTFAEEARVNQANIGFADKASKPSGLSALGAGKGNIGAGVRHVTEQVNQQTGNALGKLGIRF